ncbi:hypothetical protein [Aeromonas intestinalis]
MNKIWLGLCLLPIITAAKDHPTAECSWLFERIEILEKAIKQGDELGTREELTRRKAEFNKKSCQQYDY